MTTQKIINKAVSTAIDIALDNKHGYSQLIRNGPDFDCSSLVLYCYNSAGANTGGATYTGNMCDKMCAVGWEKLPSSKEKKMGDILLNHKHHTAIYIGGNEIVEAFSDENGGIGHNAKTGDQTGNEIRITKYYQFSAGWDCILRLPDNPVQNKLEFCNVSVPIVRKGDVSPAVCAIQSALNYHGYGWLETDGVFGEKTLEAVKRFQFANGLNTDGIVSNDFWFKILTWR